MKNPKTVTLKPMAPLKRNKQGQFIKQPRPSLWDVLRAWFKGEITQGEIK